ncbi:MAG: PEP-CTERM sorting domain-containing protein [Opitutales bacterium]
MKKISLLSTIIGSAFAFQSANAQITLDEPFETSLSGTVDTEAYILSDSGASIGFAIYGYSGYTSEGLNDLSDAATFGSVASSLGSDTIAFGDSGLLDDANLGISVGNSRIGVNATGNASRLDAGEVIFLEVTSVSAGFDTYLTSVSFESFGQGADLADVLLYDASASPDSFVYTGTDLVRNDGPTISVGSGSGTLIEAGDVLAVASLGTNAFGLDTLTFTAVAVPEPATTGLILALSFTAFVAYRRRS